MSSGHHVRVSQAFKRYGTVAALNGVDLDVAPGEFTVLLGPSGSGKSTLARGVAGIERLDGGTIHFGERRISDARHHVPANHRNLAMVFQDYALWPHLNALHNVAYSLRRRRLDRVSATRRATEALDRVGLAHLAARYPNELSGGEQQRVGLARAMVADPALVLFDEPLSNLDADLRERLRVQIATATREAGSTAIYITHDQAEAFALADRIGVLNAGRLEQVGTPEEIYHRPISPFVARFTGITGRLTGPVISCHDSQVLVRAAGEQILCRAGTTLVPGEIASIYIRPAAARLTPAEDSFTGPAGVVVDVAYRGRGYDHVIDCAGSVLTSVFDTHPRQRGSRCRVSLDPDGCSAFPDPDTAAADPTVGLTAVSTNIEQIPARPGASVPAANLEEIHR